MAAIGSVPSTFLQFSGLGGITEFRGVDLAALSGNLVEMGASEPTTVLFLDCKLHASVTVGSSAPTGPGGVQVELVNCDSGDTQTRYARETFAGIETQDTSIYLNASDGSTSFGRKLVSNADAKAYLPLESSIWSVWNTDLTEQTITIEIVHDSATNLQDDEVWLEIEYMGTSGFPLGVYKNDRLDDFVFGTAADQTSSSVTWTGTGGFTNENKCFLKFVYRFQSQ